MTPPRSPSDAPRPDGLDGRSVYAPDATLPGADGVETADDPAAADVAAFPADDLSHHHTPGRAVWYP